MAKNKIQLINNEAILDYVTAYIGFIDGFLSHKEVIKFIDNELIISANNGDKNLEDFLIDLEIIENTKNFKAKFKELVLRQFSAEFLSKRVMESVKYLWIIVELNKVYKMNISIEKKLDNFVYDIYVNNLIWKNDKICSKWIDFIPNLTLYKFSNGEYWNRFERFLFSMNKKIVELIENHHICYEKINLKLFYDDKL